MVFLRQGLAFAMMNGIVGKVDTFDVGEME